MMTTPQINGSLFSLTFLIPPARYVTSVPGGHDGLRFGQANRADLGRHANRFCQSHQGDVVGDVVVLRVDEVLVGYDRVDRDADFGGTVQIGLHVMFAKTHLPNVRS